MSLSRPCMSTMRKIWFIDFQSGSLTSGNTNCVRNKAVEIVFLATLMMLSSSQKVMAADVDSCPSELPVSQKILNAPGGWDEINTSDLHPYVGVSFSQGPPTDQVILAPDVVQEIRGGRRSVWHFSNTAQAYWISCLYAETSATVAKRLPKNIVTCEVEYDGKFSSPVAKTWRCRARPGP